MGREVRQFYIPDRILQRRSSQPNVNVWTDIGEAKVNQTIFGRATVSIIRKQDKRRRARLWAMLLVTATAAAAWQGWVIYQQRLLNTAPPPPLSASIKVSPPIFQSVNSPLVAAPPSPQVKPPMSAPLATNRLPTSPAKNQPSVLQPQKSTVATSPATPATTTPDGIKTILKQPEIVVPPADPSTKLDTPNPQP